MFVVVVTLLGRIERRCTRDKMSLGGVQAGLDIYEEFVGFFGE
jgi:hypothetical protein